MRKRVLVSSLILIILLAGLIFMLIINGELTGQIIKEKTAPTVLDKKDQVVSEKTTWNKYTKYPYNNCKGASCLNGVYTKLLETQNKGEGRGYIIKFKDVSLLEKKSELELKNALSSNKIDIGLEVKKYQEELKKQHSSFKKTINQKIGAKNYRVLGEYYSSFNGLALNINENQLSNIKKIAEIEKVYQNGIVKPNLFESPSVVGADSVWQLDEDENRCSQTGKECLTGKNVTIAIIDTGIDYTHRDFGSCNREEFLNGNCNKVIGGFDYFGTIDFNQDGDFQDCFELDDFNFNMCEEVIGPAGSNNWEEYMSRCLNWTKQNSLTCELNTPDLIAYLLDINNIKRDINSNKNYVDCYHILSNPKSNSKSYCEWDTNPIDEHGHGTHVAGILAGEPNINYAKDPFAESYQLSLSYTIGSLNSSLFLFKNTSYEYLLSVAPQLFDVPGILIFSWNDTPLIEDNGKKMNIVLRVKNIMPIAVDTNNVRILEREYVLSGPAYPGNLAIEKVDIPNKIVQSNEEFEINFTFIKPVFKGIAYKSNLISYRVLGPQGVDSDIIAAIEKSVDPNGDGNFSDKVDVISMSLGKSCSTYNDNCGPNDAMSQAVDRAVQSGVVVVVAAGNDGPDQSTIESPGTSKNAITVGATYKKDYIGKYFGNTITIGDINPRKNQIVSFSSRGPIVYSGGTLHKPDIVAPGAMICSSQFNASWNDKLCFDDEHVAISGTSMATPIISGAVALIKQAHPRWSPLQIKIAIKNSSVDLGYPVDIQGAGRIDIEKAINKTPLRLLDIDDNGGVLSDSDGKMIIMFLAGFTADYIVNNSLGEDAKRISPNDVADHLDFLKNNGYLDADGDGISSPLGDGIIISRFMSSYNGNSLIVDAISSSATRRTSEEIIDFLVSVSS